MAAVAEEPSRGYWDDEEEEEEEEEAVSATAEARAAVERVAARLCAGKGVGTRRVCGGSWRDCASGRAERRAAGPSRMGYTEVRGGRREVTLSNGARFLLLKKGPSFHKGGGSLHWGGLASLVNACFFLHTRKLAPLTPLSSTRSSWFWWNYQELLIQTFSQNVKINARFW